jgi:5'-3' exonuclease
MDETKRAGIIRYTLDDIIMMMNAFAPKKSLSVCFDGPAPLAKPKYRSDSVNPVMVELMQITPGSIFMNKLEAELVEWATSNLKVGFEITISGSRVPGEVEAKL